ncbi:hypothetical protein, conserved [Eimeria maxima]|uniref:Nucleolar protein 12 n=1 Tax=Eimeria maxima TaxID=5804 RepID=U6M293_EIMMA|nr:hypothetical protein, conserved [Eimeria maxima]CDJ56534.1 hypothetical protein, conserved [Eimeria maxima]
MKTKAPKGSAVGSVALFDFAAREEFITGASKRKEQRRKEAHERALQKQKEERRLLRAQRREEIREHINYVKRSQELAEVAAEVVTSLQGKRQKRCVGIESRGGHSNTSSQATKQEGDAAERDWKAPKPHPGQTSEAVQAVRLLPPPTNDASSSPWHIGSCVSLSLGGFIEPQAAAPPPTARAPHPQQTQSEASGNSKRKQLQNPSTSGTPNVAMSVKKRPQGTPRGAKSGKQKQKKRHKSRGTQRKRRNRK